jgi:hypothetical protein
MHSAGIQAMYDWTADKTFGGDAIGTNCHQCFLLSGNLLRSSSFCSWHARCSYD